MISASAVVKYWKTCSDILDKGRDSGTKTCISKECHNEDVLSVQKHTL